MCILLVKAYPLLKQPALTMHGRMNGDMRHVQDVPLSKALPILDGVCEFALSVHQPNRCPKVTIADQEPGAGTIFEKPVTRDTHTLPTIPIRQVAHHASHHLHAMPYST